MAIIRAPLKCLSCGSTIITRTAPGFSPAQEHKFPCPGCGVEIQFSLSKSKKKVNYSFGRPVNAKWVKSEEGAIETVTFDPERVAPSNIAALFSPFLSEFHRMSMGAHRAYAQEEGMRRAWRDSQWPWIKKLLVHFGNRNERLFDKEAKLKKGSPHVVSWAARLRLLCILLENAFDNFTLNRKPEIDRIHQRIALAQAVSPTLWDDLVNLYRGSSKLTRLWQEHNNIRAAFLSHYLALSPVLRTQYWTKPPTNWSGFKIPDKKFEELKQLYVDSFETLCRLTVVAVGIEAIIHGKSLQILTQKGSMTLTDFEAMPNGNKHTVLTKFPIHDLFIPMIDAPLRNGLGHHSASYSSATDEVIYYSRAGAQEVEQRLPYTEFVYRVLAIVSKVELGALYLQALLIRACELEAPSQVSA